MVVVKSKGWEVGGLGEESQKVQTCTNKSQGCNVQPGDNS